MLLLLAVDDDIIQKGYAFVFLSAVPMMLQAQPLIRPVQVEDEGPICCGHFHNKVVQARSGALVLLAVERGSRRRRRNW